MKYNIMELFMDNLKNNTNTTDFENSKLTTSPSDNIKYLYELKQSLITATEQKYLSAVKSVLPSGYIIQPQVNLACIINRTDDSKYCNELYRNIDACIFDSQYKPIFLIEINDSTHNQNNRIQRDKKIKNICEEAGIPLVTFWTSYGVNTEYMKKKIDEAIISSKNPKRICHSATNSEKKQENKNQINDTPQAKNTNQKSSNSKKKKQGCYVATAVYGSYDCPQVWTLRRFRDDYLASVWYGKLFISFYYYISPNLVKLFGNTHWFNRHFKNKLDKMVLNLQAKGYASTRYIDKDTND